MYTTASLCDSLLLLATAHRTTTVCRPSRRSRAAVNRTSSTRPPSGCQRDVPHTQLYTRLSNSSGDTMRVSMVLAATMRSRRLTPSRRVTSRSRQYWCGRPSTS
ncbi:hypothetical protein E2C01_030217 [Portunus trituberculatus]|uniref:Secreted protein n=1 Tax=Portunus trituberculatus TaxID=210409 RepID=A0A5B7EUR8_PORTR|nr:hypothetical protein [Portunus trituberculatus]